ncbi:MAG TPA: flagellar basal body P-ring formation chaperone FlgA [Bryobacteraceae bacterium]|nr:flagellar basal body P-ring formation chaperone FlgA [Bryobacteraceae bacterium]
MKISLTVCLALAFAPYLAFPGACLRLPGERILVRDLVPVVPALRSLDPQLALGYSPAPGMIRVVRRPELESWMRSRGLTPDADVPASLCLERATFPLTAARIQNALERSLDGVTFPGAPVRMQLVDFSRFPLPPATLEFPLSGLARPSPATPDAPVLWMGSAVFDGGRHASVWAKVVLKVRRKILVAATSIPEGREITGGETRVEERMIFPYPAPAPLLSADVIGKALRRPLTAGDAITSDLLMDLPAVRRGEQTGVIVEDGAIRILLNAKADSAGAKGDAIVLVNPSSGRKFRGTIVNRRQVVVQLKEKDT